MLKKILSKAECAKCKICCTFSRDELCELPAVNSKQLSVSNFDKKGICKCMELEESGCKLGKNKPFDCKIWPFRLMDFNGSLVLAVCSMCPLFFNLPLSKIYEFADNEFISKILNLAERGKISIQPYREGYSILTEVKNKLNPV